jgi:hypothetical protein
MLNLCMIRRLGSAALRWLRQPSVTPSCRRPSFRKPSLEMLPNRILPSIDLVIPVHADYSLDLAEPEIEQMRFMEIPKSGDLLKYWDSGTFSLSAKEMLDIIGGPSHAEQFDTPVVTRGKLEIEGETFATLNVGFGSSLKGSFVFAEEGAGSAGNPESATYACSSLLGGLVEVYGGERRFLMRYRGSEMAESGAPSLFPLLSAEYSGDKNATQPGPGDRPATGEPEPMDTTPSSGTTGSSLALFMAGLGSGTQIAGGLSALSSADDADVNAMAEVYVQPLGNPADVLFTVDTVLPDAKTDLVGLQNADLAVVPTYVVGPPPTTALAPRRVDDRLDLDLAAQVVGLDEFPGDGRLTPPDTDRLFKQPAWVDDGGGVAACKLDLEGMQLGAIDVGNAAQPEAKTEESAAPTDHAPAFREWLDGLLQHAKKSTVMVPVIALEALLAFAYCRGLRPDRQGDRPK